MKIIFDGTVNFSPTWLEHLINLGAEVVGVVTKEKSNFNTDFADLGKFCEIYDIDFLHTNDVNSTTAVSWIFFFFPDVILCFGWSSLLGDEILRRPPLGVIGFHPAALPNNRGRHPITWALALSLKNTASTFFVMESSDESGDIISQEEILISDDDDAGSLYQKVTQKALGQIESFMPNLANNQVRREKQNSYKSNSWRKRSEIDGVIDWRMSARSIHNLVRGLARPYVGAHFIFNKKKIKVWKTMILFDAPVNVEPGKILLYHDCCPVIKCGEGAIKLKKTEPTFEPIEGLYL